MFLLELFSCTIYDLQLQKYLSIFLWELCNLLFIFLVTSGEDEWSSWTYWLSQWSIWVGVPQVNLQTVFLQLICGMYKLKSLRCLTKTVNSLARIKVANFHSVSCFHIVCFPFSISLGETHLSIEDRSLQLPQEVWNFPAKNLCKKSLLNRS